MFAICNGCYCLLHDACRLSRGFFFSRKLAIIDSFFLPYSWLVMIVNIYIYYVRMICGLFVYSMQYVENVRFVCKKIRFWKLDCFHPRHGCIPNRFYLVTSPLHESVWRITYFPTSRSKINGRTTNEQKNEKWLKISESKGISLGFRRTRRDYSGLICLFSPIRPPKSNVYFSSNFHILLHSNRTTPHQHIPAPSRHFQMLNC